MSQAQKKELPSLDAYRDDFPALRQDVNGHPLAYLDSAASAQQPAVVIDAVARYHKRDHANVHRGVHTLSHRATDAYEGARDKLQRADQRTASRRGGHSHERHDGEAINLVAQSFCRPRLAAGRRRWSSRTSSITRTSCRGRSLTSRDRRRHWSSHRSMSDGARAMGCDRPARFARRTRADAGGRHTFRQRTRHDQSRSTTSSPLAKVAATFRS